MPHIILFMETAKTLFCFRHSTSLQHLSQPSHEPCEESHRSAAAALLSNIYPAKGETMTVAQQYIKDHGPAPKELREDDDAGMMPVVDALVHWSGKGNLASYRALEPKLTQKYRLYGEKCVVIGCKRTVDAPKYIMVRHFSPPYVCIDSS